MFRGNRGREVGGRFVRGKRKIRWVTHAAKMSARSAYCQYSRFGIGSRSEAGRDRRLLESAEESPLKDMRRHGTELTGTNALTDWRRPSLRPTCPTISHCLIKRHGTRRNAFKSTIARLRRRSLLEQSQEDLQFAFLAASADLGEGRRRTSLICECLQGYEVKGGDGYRRVL
jgi:hypothetical protein